MNKTINNIIKGTLVAVASLAVIGGVSASPKDPSVQQYTPDQKFVTGEVLVQYKSGVSESAALSSSKTMGKGQAKALSFRAEGKGPIYLVKLKKAQDVENTIKMIESNPDVDYAQPNYIYHATVAPNDTNYGEQWGMKNSAQTISPETYATNNPGTSGKDIDAESAWGLITDCSSVTVAVVDTGVDYNHPDLSGNMVSGSYSCPGSTTGTVGCDFVGTGDNDPMDLAGHGSHVAGIIGATGNDSTGVTGVCQSASILAVRVLDSNGTGTTADIVEGIGFAAGQSAGQGQASIINMSLGGSTYDSAYSSAITTAQTNGVIIVAAAGNSGNNHYTTHSYPCDYSQSNIICVAAVDQSYNIASFSDYDSRTTTSSRLVDIGAPGTNILSSVPTLSTTVVGTDDFSTGWTLGSYWGVSSGGAGTYCSGASLTLPSDFCTNYSAVYANNISSNASYKSIKGFTAGSDEELVMSFDAEWYIEPSFDYLYISVDGNSIYVDGSNNYNFQYPVTDCATSVSGCFTYFSFRSDSSGAYSGVAISNFQMNKLAVTGNTYEVMDGTSMATPFVAGIATMVKARNPNFTKDDVINAILTGGDLESSMTSKTKSGRVADAYGSLKYIPQTEGVVLTP